jgi:hypothetical protein
VNAKKQNVASKNSKSNAPLKKNGYASSNNKPNKPPLKKNGFVSSNNKPTRRRLRDPTTKATPERIRPQEAPARNLRRQGRQLDRAALGNGSRLSCCYL